MKWARAKSWCASALGALAICCRFRYEQLEPPSSGDGGVATNGGDAASGLSGIAGGAVGGAFEPGDGGARSAGEGGDGAVASVGGMNGGTSGTSGTSGSSTGGSSAGTGGQPSVCVPDASCACEVFQDHQYRFCGVLTTREAGLAACESANMGLTRVDSAEENIWLHQKFIEHGMFLGTGSSIVILDGNDIQVEGEWRWEDGALFWDESGAVGDFYTNWAFPPKTGQGDCVGMMLSGLWEDRACTSGNATVACESP